MPHPKYLWMAVTADEHETPLVVCDSARELAEWSGVATDTVVTAEYRHISGKHKGYKYVKVVDE